MKVLVTGSAGMLGSSIVRELRLNGAIEVAGLSRHDGDLLDPKTIRVALDNHKPDAIIHAAAKVGGIQANIASPVDFLASNLVIDSNVITGALASGVSKLFYIGSSCMYPRDYRQPLVESDILMGPLEPTNEGYALAKISGSKLCQYASLAHGVHFKTIIPSNLYGPGDNFNPGSSHLLSSVIRKVHEAKQSGAIGIEVWGSGLARREFTYVEDLAKWMTRALNHLPDLPPVLNVGCGVDYSVNEFYETAMSVMGYQALLQHDLSKPEGMKAKLMDSSLARDHFGWAPETDLRRGIEMTYSWYLKGLGSR
jgi:GDP-L-fucose synthase